MTHDPHPMTKSLSRYWLLLGVIALAVAGLYSLTLVMGRAPMLSNNLEIQRIFRDALVVHVDLSVLVWFLAVACLLWSLSTAYEHSVFPYLEEGALICVALTILFMMLSPFDPQAEAMMSNYIPVISSPLFMMSLGFMACGVGFMLVKIILPSLQKQGFSSNLQAEFLRGNDALYFGIVTSAYITLVALACFVWSYHLMPPVLEGAQYFEILFWGGGHVLQLTHTQVLMVVWLLMASAVCHRKMLAQKYLYALFTVGLLAALASPIAYFRYDIASSEFRAFFTHQMIALGGVAPGIMGLVMLCWLWQSRTERKGGNRAIWACAVVSVLLFLYGGVLAMMIQGQNVVIPAHYHGSIVGITLAFMGFAYMMLPRFGYADVGNWRMAYWQPVLYGVGQVMHVSGLAYSGGYGVLRKTAGGVDALAPNIKIALGVMGFGGLFAIIGGLLFVVVVYRAVKQKA